MVRDRLADIVERITESLEAVTVGDDREIALDERTELDFEVDGACRLVVEEEVADQHVDIMGGLVLRHDDVKDLLIDGVVQPGADDEVLPVPLGGAVGLRGHDEDVVGELIFAEEDGDEHTPLAVVGLAEVEDDGTCVLMFATFIARKAGEVRVNVVTRKPDEGESLRAEVMDEEVLAGAVMAAVA
jgi:hypothetical protein